MKRKNNRTTRIRQWVSLSRIVAIILAIIAFFVVKNWLDNTTAKVEVDDQIGLTPTQIESIRQIGQWEFLSIADEELIDTVRRGFFSDDQLIRIYYGTLRLGIDLQQMKENAISQEGDSISILLPPIKLLDQDFIDEARTQSFYESGKWSDTDRHDLYLRAERQMRKRCLTTENLRSAEENASRQMAQLLKSMGFHHTVVRFEERKH